jgi:hypothetical protein
MIAAIMGVQPHDRYMFRRQDRGFGHRARRKTRRKTLCGVAETAITVAP